MKIKGKMALKLKNNHPTLLTMPKLMVEDTSLKVVAYYWPQIIAFPVLSKYDVGHFEKGPLAGERLKIKLGNSYFRDQQGRISLKHIVSKNEHDLPLTSLF